VTNSSYRDRLNPGCQWRWYFTIGGNTFNGAGFTVSASIATSPGITAATFSLTNEPARASS